MAIYQLGADAPLIAPTAWVAESAQVVGRVELGEQCGVWYGAVLRGDNEWIRIGARSNVQDSAVMHTDPGFPLVVGVGASVGHQVLLHGCTVGDGALIGMQSVVMNGARIGARCLVAAGSLVPEGKVFDEGWLIMGSPAKAVRPLTPEQLAMIERAASNYVTKAEWHRTQARRIA